MLNRWQNEISCNTLVPEFNVGFVRDGDLNLRKKGLSRGGSFGIICMSETG
jgi:hypothetical protein